LYCNRIAFYPASQSVQFLTTNINDLLYLCGLFNSVVFDFILKKKLSGIDLTQSVINQIPVPEVKNLESDLIFNGISSSIKQHVSSLVFYLLKNDLRLIKLSETVGLYDIQIKNRELAIKEIDLLFMHLYKLTNSEIDLLLLEFQKQYSSSDTNWFKRAIKCSFK
jgi:hypothetical protein